MRASFLIQCLNTTPTRKMTHTWQIKTDFVISILITLNNQISQQADTIKQTHAMNCLFLQMEITAQCQTLASQEKALGRESYSSNVSRWSGTYFKGLITFDPSVHQLESVCMSLSKPEGEMDRQCPHVVVFWKGWRVCSLVPVAALKVLVAGVSLAGRSLHDTWNWPYSPWALTLHQYHANNHRRAIRGLCWHIRPHQCNTRTRWHLL